MTSDPRILVIGAGPTGLGAAWRLQELGHANWTLYESAAEPGGLAASIVDPCGFTWDMGGHVLFSHYRYFDRLMVEALGDRWVEHVREAWVRMRQQWIPYPLQNNVWRLPDAELIACLEGLLDVHGRRNGAPPDSFRAWLLQAFGTGLCEAFMFPYNRKVWAYDPSELDVGWMGERVATVDLARILRNLVRRQDDAGWGPNSTFRFPLAGGTGAIWQAIAGRLPAERLRFNHTVVRVDAAERRIHFAGGGADRYDYLISSMPLDLLLRMLRGLGDRASDAGRFVHSSSHIVGLGFEGPTPAQLATKCWMYFPEADVPFYRATVFSNYSPNNVARPREQWSLMAEVSESPVKPVDVDRIVDDVVEGFVTAGIVERGTPIVSRWWRRLEHGYPTPWLGRDAVLHPIDEALRGAAIYSRGRFGAWKYEVSNQDHSVMQGVEAVNRILQGADERTYHGHMSD